MSVDEYMQKQDRTFDTFRSTFDLGPASPVRAITRRTDQLRTNHASTSSIPSLRDILMHAPVDHDDSEPNTAVAPMHFAPQMRRIEAAPWEATSDRVDTDDDKKTKKARRKGNLFSKFRRVTSINRTPEVAPLSPISIDNSPIETTSSTYAPISPAPSPVPQLLVNRADVPLGPVIDSEIVDADTLSLAFRPIDPNIIQLRPTQHTNEPKSAVPRITCTFDTLNPKDRMSRMFDNLEF